MSLVTMPALIGPICGPPLGGFITTYASWHWIFIINVPIGLVGIVAGDALYSRTCAPSSATRSTSSASFCPASASAGSPSGSR